jgi:hypothetical protein
MSSVKCSHEFIEPLMIFRLKSTAFVGWPWKSMTRCGIFEVAYYSSHDTFRQALNLCRVCWSLHMFCWIRKIKSAKNYNTGYSQVVSHPSTMTANTRLTSEIRRDLVQLVCMVGLWEFIVQNTETHKFTMNAIPALERMTYYIKFSDIVVLEHLLRCMHWTIGSNTLFPRSLWSSRNNYTSQ